MSSERDLRSLLIAMKPALDPREWVFCCVDRSHAIDELKPLMVFQENEGTTLIIEREAAEAAQLPYDFPCRRITLRVHSSLDAVGFVAKLTGELAKHTIPVNTASGFYHDHLFVPVERAEEALRALEDISNRAARDVL